MPHKVLPRRVGPRRIQPVLYRSAFPSGCIFPEPGRDLYLIVINAVKAYVLKGGFPAAARPVSFFAQPVVFQDKITQPAGLPVRRDESFPIDVKAACGL